MTLKYLIRHPEQVGTWRHVMVRHVYSLTYGAMDIMMWKGVWDGWDDIYQ